jgi:hypothetical protein
MVTVLCNTSGLNEKELACRVLMQYCVDVPELICPFITNIITSTAPLIETYVYSEEISFVAGSLSYEAISVFLSNSQITEDNSTQLILEANNLINISLTCLAKGNNIYICYNNQSINQ